MGNCGIVKTPQQLKMYKSGNDLYEAFASLKQLDEQIFSVMFEMLKKKELEIVYNFSNKFKIKGQLKCNRQKILHYWERKRCSILE
ncbi:unnamed protein product [Paramecium octaurelia]|uniref:Uncharacterized protein n=1 Tax=Paramecium octaurelia TaxID=43137 RepID=A0A8S1YK64_PAROT|nr:unnamed protein product [Paramecium octaurelia]